MTRGSPWPLASAGGPLPDSGPPEIALPTASTVMKGKRKVKTSKWQQIQAWTVQAQRQLEQRSTRASRFLDVALAAGREAEPVGRLAGR